MWVEVKVFDDEKRHFVSHTVQTENVNAVCALPVSLYGKEGEFVCRKVLMPGTVLFVAEPDASKLMNVNDTPVKGI